jgi:hypothetical protein
MSEVKSKDATVTKTKTLDGIMSEEYEQPDEQFHFEGTMFEKWILNSTAKETHEGDGEEKAEEEKKKEKAMNLPEEVNLLASVLNLYLRDRYSSLDALCEDGELDRSLLEEKLNKGGYQYDEEHNCFRAK